MLFTHSKSCNHTLINVPGMHFNHMTTLDPLKQSRLSVCEAIPSAFRGDRRGWGLFVERTGTLCFSVEQLRIF